MKQIIEKVMKNLCHDKTILASKTHPNPPLQKEGTRTRHAELVSASRISPSSDTSCHLLPPMGRRQLNFGFTLAEVLITLGIIGVVAALTLPTLIQNYQKQVWVNQLKKAVSVWENGMKMMLADADTDDLRNTEFWQNLYAIHDHYGCDSENDYSVPDNILKKYFKILKFGDHNLVGDEGCSVGVLNDGTEYRALNGDSYGIYDPDTRKIYMADGTLYGFWAYNWLASPWNNNPDFIGTITIDVNGENKGPNQWGRDSFTFYILPNGNLVSNYSYEELKKDSDRCGDLETGDISNAYGIGCAARIIADGWKMNY